MIQIISRYNAKIVLYECGEDTMIATLQKAIKEGADLLEADLRGADLDRATLYGADLRDANLYRADLREAKVNWQSRDLVSELLYRAAGDDLDKRKVARQVLASQDWCWDDFLHAGDPLRDWALDELSKWVQSGDNAPEVLTELAAQQPGKRKLT